MEHSTLVTEDNPELGNLKRRWVLPEFEPIDGFGSLDSLYQMTDAIAAVVCFDDGIVRSVGSAVMIGPGLALTATHVLDEFKSIGKSPVLLTFLPGGEARAWLPKHTINSHRPSSVLSFSSTPEAVSDLSVLTCDLNSDAHSNHSLCLTPLRVRLPVPGDRLWAIGFRQGDISDRATGMIPLAASGTVIDAYPQGRGKMLISSCVSVDMNTMGGMSGGPVFDSDGFVVGIVSSSFDGGPTFVTLIWNALTLRPDGLPRSVWPFDSAPMQKVIETGLVKVEGHIRFSDDGNIIYTLTREEGDFANQSENIIWDM